MSTERQHVREKLDAMRERSLTLGKELERQLSAARGAYHQLNQRAGALVSERDAVRAELERANHDMESAREEFDRLAAEFSVQLEAEHAAQRELQEKVEQLMQQRQEQQAQQTRLEQHVVDLEQGLQRQQDLEARLVRSQEQVAALEHTVQKSFDDIESFQRREKEHAAERESLDRQLGVARAEASAAANEKKALAVDFATTRSEFDSARRGHLEEINSLEQRLADVESDRDNLRRQSDDLESTLLEAASRQVEDLERALQNVRDAVTDAESAPEVQFDQLLRAKNEELERLKSQLHTLGEEHDAAIEFLQRAGQEAEHLRLEAESGADAELEQALRSREQELETLREQLQQLTGERDTANESVQQAGAEIAALRTEVEKIQALRDGEVLSEETLSELQNELDQARHDTERAERERKQAEQHVRELESSRKPRSPWQAAAASLLVGVLAGIGIAWILQKHVLHTEPSRVSQDVQSSALATDGSQAPVSAIPTSVYATSPPAIPGPYPVK